jgi:hypothetical protein
MIITEVKPEPQRPNYNLNCTWEELLIIGTIMGRVGGNCKIVGNIYQQIYNLVKNYNGINPRQNLEIEYNTFVTADNLDLNKKE